MTYNFYDFFSQRRAGPAGEWVRISSTKLRYYAPGSMIPVTLRFI